MLLKKQKSFNTNPTVCAKEHSNDVENKEKDFSEIKNFFIRLVVFLFVLYILFGWIFGLKAMPNNDMQPALKAGDLLLYYRISPNLNIDNVVVYQQKGQIYVGRIVAQAGDQVDISNKNQLIVNGNNLYESNIFHPTTKIVKGVRFPLTVPTGSFMILSDSREGAKDSRYFGPINQKEIKGRVITAIRRNEI